MHNLYALLSGERLLINLLVVTPDNNACFKIDSNITKNCVLLVSFLRRVSDLVHALLPISLSWFFSLRL